MPLASKRPVAVCSVSIVLSTTSTVMCRMYLAVRSGPEEVRRRLAIVCVIGACSSVCNAKGRGWGNVSRKGVALNKVAVGLGRKLVAMQKR